MVAPRSHTNLIEIDRRYDAAVAALRVAGAEKATMLVLCGLAAVGCLLGIFDPPSLGMHATHRQEVMDLIRVLTTTAMAITLLLGPGTVWRALGRRRICLAVVPLPGLALLALTGLAAWLLAGSVDVKTTSFAVLGPALGLIIGVVVSLEDDVFEPEERRTLVLTSLALALGIARALWSFGPEGEMFEGSIARTLQPEGRPDSQTSYLVARLLVHGAPPYGKIGLETFQPYNFSSRGPVPGMASAPIMLMSGTRPALTTSEFAWQPFDGQGFMAYRIAMMTFSCSAFLALWQLVRRVGGARAARFALLLAVSTPFVIDDLMFTWPKLLAAAFALIGFLWVIERRPFRAGLVVGAGYLMHPSALVGLTSIVPVAFWPPRRPDWRWPRWRRPRVLTVILLGLGTAVAVEFWRLYNGVHLQQEGFLEYIGWSSVWNTHPSVLQWLEFRFASLAGTLVPMFTPIFHPHTEWNNRLAGQSPGVVHIFDQYWTNLGFGLGILFYPLLLSSLWRAARRWPWPMLTTIVIPFCFFVVYWGFDLTGLLREGLQYWVLLVIGAVALDQSARGFPWLRSVPVRLILCVRALEVFAVLVALTWGTRGLVLASSIFTLNDAVALTAMVLLAALLIVVVWRETGADLGFGPAPPARPAEAEPPRWPASTARAPSAAP